MRLRRNRLTPGAFESIFNHASHRRQVAEWVSAHHIRRVIIADYSKNLFASYRACVDAHVETLAIVDDRQAFAGMTYRGVPVCALYAVDNSSFDGIVVSNVNPAQIDSVANSIRELFPSKPVLALWRGVTFERLAEPIQNHSSSRAA